MGNSQKQQVDNPHFNMALYNQRLQQSTLYTNAGLNPNAAQFHQSAQPKTFTVQQKQVRKIQAAFAFYKKTIRIVPSAKSLDISFKYIAKAEGVLTIFLIAQEIEDPATYITSDIHAQAQLSREIKPSPVGTQEQFQAQIDLPRSVSEMGFGKGQSYSCYQLLIRFECPDQKLYAYLKPSSNFQVVHLIKTKIQLEGQGHFFEEVYGLTKPDEDKLCIVCYTEPSSVIVYPCRHMCLCKECCIALKERSEKCPICRSSKYIDHYTNIKENN